MDRGLQREPFHEFTYEERIEYAFSRPLQFEPGTNWSYAHTNFMILGDILPRSAAAARRAARGEGARSDGSHRDRGLRLVVHPRAVLHAFSSERASRSASTRPTPFYEESSFWNPVGAPDRRRQTTTIADMTKTAIAIGTGELLCDESFHEMTDSQLIGFGEKLRVRTVVLHAGRGLQLRPRGGAIGRWMLQNPC